MIGLGWMVSKWGRLEPLRVLHNNSESSVATEYDLGCFHIWFELDVVGPNCSDLDGKFANKASDPIGQICTPSKFTWNILICPPLSTQLSNYVDCHICQAYALVLGANRQVSTIKIIEKCDIPIPKNADEFYWTNWDTYPDHHWKLSSSFLLLDYSVLQPLSRWAVGIWRWSQLQNPQVVIKLRLRRKWSSRTEI